MEIERKIDSEDYLEHMFELQRSFQLFAFQKRPETIPDPNETDIKAAIYFWNATTVEFNEFLETPEWESANQVEEIIDMLHFVMCQLIYLGFKGDEFRSLPSFYRMAQLKVDEMGGYFNRWSKISSDWAKLIETYPFKIWKDYDVSSEENSTYQIKLANEFLCSFFILCVQLKINENLLYLGYINKNQENFARQQPGGKYEKQEGDICQQKILAATGHH